MTGRGECIRNGYCKFSIKSPQKAYFFQARLGGVGGGGRRCFIERGYLSNLTKLIVSILHQEQERKVEKRRHMKLVVMQPKMNNKFELLAHE